MPIRLPPGAAGARRDLILAIVLGTLAAALTVLQAWVLSGIIAEAFLGGRQLPTLAAALLVLAGLACAKAAVAWTGDVLAQRAAVRTKATLRGMLVDRVFELGPRGLTDERTGEVAHTLTGGLESFDAYVGQYLPQSVLAITIPIVIGGCVLAADPLSALVLLITYPLIPLFMVLIGGAARERTRAQWLELSRLSVRFLDALQGLTTLQAFGRSRAEGESIAQAGERFRVITMGVLRVAFVSALVLELLSTLSTAVVAVEVGLRLLYDRIAFRDGLFVLVLAPEFYRPLRALGAAFHAGLSGREVEARARALLEPAATSSKGAAPAGTLDPIAPPAIAFDRVTFRYGGGRQAAVDDVSFSLPAGRVVALAGPSGAGKTTVAALLLRFLEPEAGSILVNGRPLSGMDADAWRSQVAWVPQRPHLFYGTLLDNIRMARPQATRAEVEDAVRRAGASSFVRDLPEGLNTQLGEDAQTLSGGQAQRVALARAFLKQAPVVVLDEPTSQLDPRHEAEIAESIRRLSGSHTVLLIAHRPSTMAAADHIVRLPGAAG